MKLSAGDRVQITAVGVIEYTTGPGGPAAIAVGDGRVIFPVNAEVNIERLSPTEPNAFGSVVRVTHTGGEVLIGSKVDNGYRAWCVKYPGAHSYAWVEWDDFIHEAANVEVLFDASKLEG